MKRLITLATVLVVGLASVQAAQTDDQKKKKKKKQQTTQTTSAQTSSGSQSSKKHVSSQAGAQHVSSQTSSNQHATKTYSKKVKSNAGASANQQNNQVVYTNKSKKSKNQAYVVSNNNVQYNKKAYRHYTRTGNEWSYNVARTRYVRERHDRNWWNHHYSRITFYGGGYWYWNSGWWYPAWGYNPYYNNYVYNGPIFGYGYARPGDVTSEVQRALAQQGYYYGPIDGILGPGTRSAIQRYQINHGLAVTAAIDEPTLYRLGLA